MFRHRFAADLLSRVFFPALALFFLGCNSNLPQSVSYDHSQGWSKTGLGPEHDNIFPVVVLDRMGLQRNGDGPAGDWAELKFRQTFHGDDKPIPDGAISCDIELVESQWYNSYTRTVDLKEGENSLFVPIPWKWEAVLANTETRPINVELRFKLHIGGEDEFRVCNYDFILHGSNECPLQDQTSVFRWIFTSFVNEDDPSIPQIIAEARDAGNLGDLLGYQYAGTESDLEKRRAAVAQQVRNQMAAVWLALQARHVAYSNVTDLGYLEPGLHSQYVRRVGESLTDKQANCIEGSALFASIFRKMGLDPCLVFVPGHCFVGVRGGDDPSYGNKWFFLETTMIGNNPGLAGFDAAMDEGGSEFDRYRTTINEGTDKATQLVSVSKARQLGYRPIP